jgi:hypothetical protein
LEERGHELAPLARQGISQCLTIGAKDAPRSR